MRFFKYLFVFYICCITNVYSQHLGDVISVTNFKSKNIKNTLIKSADGSFYKFSKSTMCTAVQSALPWDPINESKFFVPVDSAAIAWVELTDLYVPIRVKWVFIDPKSNVYYESESDWTTNPSSSGYDHWSWWKLWSWIYINGFSPADLVNWGEWKVDIFVEENYSGVWIRENTLSFRIDAFNVQIDELQNETIPEEFFLYQNYPNPFNSTSIITISLPEEKEVSLILYDLLGNKLRILIHEIKPAGIYHFELIADDLPSGMYFYELRAGNFSDIKKLVLLR